MNSDYNRVLIISIYTCLVSLRIDGGGEVGIGSARFLFTAMSLITSVSVCA
jgi:hypothetical protein